VGSGFDRRHRYHCGLRVGNGSLQSTGYETDVYAGAVGGNFGLTDAFHLQHAGQVAIRR
jgi:hypothetical protein